MTTVLDVTFAPLAAPLEAATAVLVGSDLAKGKTLARLDKAAGGQIMRAAAAARFSGRRKKSCDVLAPHALDLDCVCLIGVGAATDAKSGDWIDLGGTTAGRLGGRQIVAASLVVELAQETDLPVSEIAALMALGAQLRSYTFDKYRAKKKDENGEGADADRRLERLTIHVADPAAARAAFARHKAVAEGVVIARDLVNEPANALGPVEFAARCRELEQAGVDVEILEPEQLTALGMHALLGVAQGSARPARVAVMLWNGAKSKRAKPLCFIGKGVVFDTGGISIKPAAGMEDMKGDMGGAAAVVGLMHALASRKAPVNVIGIVGLVENMVSSTAQRPGDIVTSMSGQTIEVLNTDAEGRLVLADLLWYAQDRFKPRFMVNLATLTGAILIALGKEYAGLFSNDDKLAADLSAAGEATAEKVWRMPLAPAYDKLIDSRNADMKNIGGRLGGAITAAQFLQRFVKDTPWAHLDVAGTAMDSNKTEISQGWASGWGVRLLDTLVADHYERG